LNPDAVPIGETMSEQEEGYRYDVFISYSHADEAWVTGTLLPRLEAAGLRVCIDFRDFIAGKAALINMQDAVRNSRHTLLVITQRWVDSEWTFYESLLSRTKEPAGLQRRTIPLRLERCELPEFISMLTYVDLTRPDRLDLAWTQLLTALGAPPTQEAPPPPRREEWFLKHPYPMPPNFTGRLAEREMLSEWLHADGGHPLLVLRALGGFGKSALAWHWLLHDVDPAAWPRVVWWGFYDEREFDSFLRETLDYLQRAMHLRGASHPSPRQQADELLRLLHRPGTLLILDGFERTLRAYSSMNAAYQGDHPLSSPDVGRGEGDGGRGEGQRDCVSPLAENFLRGVATMPGIRGKIFLTTRLLPRILQAHGGDLLQGCCEEELTQMQPADAVAFFRAQGIRGSRAEIERACAPYGYHPLSLRLLAGLIVRDPQQPGDVSAARRLDVSGDLLARRHHVLEQAYSNLAPGRQQLLSRIACFRGAVGYEALRALTSQTSEVSLDDDLRDLVARGLLHHDRQKRRYNLHPIVRRYAYDRLGDPERQAVHGQLRDYFAAVPEPDQVRTLDDLAAVIELYHHTVRAGQYGEAFRLFSARIHTAIYYQFGAYQLQIELLRALFPDGEDKPPRLKDESAQAWTLNALAGSYALSGQPRRAVPLVEQHNAICEKQADKLNLAAGLGNLASMAQIHIGALQAAEANLRRALALDRELEDERSEAIEHQELGRLLAYRGVWAEAEEELAAALALFEKGRVVQSQCVVWAYRALRALLLARTQPQYPVSNIQPPLSAARRALQLADEVTRTTYPVERDYVRAHWLLGAAHLVNGHLDDADRHLTEALTRCRSINAVDAEADILLDLARLRRDQGHGDEAMRLAEEALIITERSEYVLQGADVHLFLAEMALERGDREAALAHAQRARQLATCDGPPDYTYRVAYDEAGALLARLEEPV
jgi:tetratricopeptide (TPR) repeat protein